MQKMIRRHVCVYGSSSLVRRRILSACPAKLTIPLVAISANWKSRAEIIDYCVSVVDSELKQKETKLNAILDSPSSTSAQSPSSGLFAPSRPRGDIWQGPSSDFYRPGQRINNLPPQSSTEPEERKRIEAAMSTEDRHDAERRRREMENDAKSSLYEERVKVCMLLWHPYVQACFMMPSSTFCIYLNTVLRISIENPDHQ